GASAAEEMIRWVTPVKEFMRTATEDRTIRGTTIEAGQSVYLAYLSANRDEEVFDDPFRFDVGRPDNRQIAFRFGAHFCRGPPLPRLGPALFLEELLSRLEPVELAGGVTRSSPPFVGGINPLPVRYRLSR